MGVLNAFAVQRVAHARVSSAVLIIIIWRSMGVLPIILDGLACHYVTLSNLCHVMNEDAGLSSGFVSGRLCRCPCVIPGNLPSAHSLQ